MEYAPRQRIAIVLTAFALDKLTKVETIKHIRYLSYETKGMKYYGLKEAKDLVDAYEQFVKNIDGVTI